jgi:lysozyme family protein
MATFKLAYIKMIGHEGGYSDKSTDRGGETYRGISRVNFPNWKGWPLVDHYKSQGPFTEKSLTEKLDNDPQLNFMVADFYEAEFWVKLKLNQIGSQAIANELFDTGVNQGRGTAAKYLQETVNLLNKNQFICKDIAVDGGIGKQTLGAYNAILKHYAKYGSKIEETILKALNGLQFERYKDICKKDPRQESNFFGWVTNRVD